MRPARSSIRYRGQRDLEARLLRHVSEAFVEDPVRILRVARFAARYAPLGFARGRGDAGAHATHGGGRRSRRTGAGTRLGRNRKGAGRAATGRVLQRAARVRRVESDLSGNRRPVRRAAAGEMASRSRYRSAPAAGAAPGGAPRRWRRRALRGAHARSRQGTDTRGSAALASRPRRSRRRIGRTAVRTACACPFICANWR